MDESRYKQGFGFRNVWTITRLTFFEAARRRILLAALLLGLAFLAIYDIGFHFINVQMEKEMGPGDLLVANQMRNFLLMAGMYVINFLTAMMTVLISVDTLSGEITSGTIHTLLSKPLRRWEVVLGKWLGFAIMIGLYLVLMTGGILGFIYMRSGYTANNPWQAVGLMFLNALLLLSVSLLGGARFSTLTNGVLVFGLYGISFIGGWIEQIGSFFTHEAAGRTAVNIGIITSLIMPSEALWKRAAHELESPLMSLMGFTPFSARTYPSAIMIGYSVLYLLVALALTIQIFKRRDL